MALPRGLASLCFLGWSLCFPFFRRAGVHARHTLAISKSGPCAAAGFAGRCKHRPLHWFVVSQGLLFPGWPQHLPLAVGADSISARGGFLHRKVCGTMQASSPTKVYYNLEVAVSRLAAGPPWFVGEGFIPPAGVPAAAGSGGMRASRPTVARVIEAAPVGRAFAMVRRGGPNQPSNVPTPATPFFAAAFGRRSTLSKL